MCEWGTYEEIEIDGKAKHVDKCIAPLIRTMREYGIDTVASCCGHGKTPLSLLVKTGSEIYEIQGKTVLVQPPLLEIVPSSSRQVETLVRLALYPMTERDKQILDVAREVMRKQMASFVYENGYGTRAVPQAALESLTELVVMHLKNRAQA